LREVVFRFVFRFTEPDCDLALVLFFAAAIAPVYRHLRQAAQSAVEFLI
jgi:hypothetical protein